MNFDSAVSRTLALRTLIPDSPRLSARRFHPVLLLTLLFAAPAAYAQAPPVADAGSDQVVLPGSPVARR